MKNLGIIAVTVILVIAFFAILNMFDTRGRSPSFTEESVPQQSVSNVVITTSTPDLLIATSSLASTPTATPGPIDEDLWTPTPIQIGALPTPEPGLANVVGRVLCNGVPAKQYLVYLVLISGDPYLIQQAGYTDETGRWFAKDVPPGTYTVMNKPPKSFGTALSGRWDIKADQLTDFGDLNLAPSLCN